MKSYYEILGVSPEASIKEIKKSFHRLAAMCHPDRVQYLDPEIQELANEKMKRLNLAYTVIKNDKNKALYDQQLKELHRRPASEEKPETSSPSTPPYQGAPVRTDKKNSPNPWGIYKDAALDRLQEIFSRSALSLRPLELHHSFFNRVFEGRKGRTHFFMFVRIEEKITPVILTQILTRVSFPENIGKNWYPLKKIFSLVCLMGWGFQDLALLKRLVQDHNRSQLIEINGQKKDERVFLALLDYTTDQIYAPELNQAVTPLYENLKDISRRKK
jgi:hypothetical protein